VCKTALPVGRRKYCSDLCHKEFYKGGAVRRERGYDTRYRNKNKRSIVASNKKWYETHKDSIREHRREWRKTWPKYQFYKKRQSGWISVKVIQQVYEDNIKKYGTLTCKLCNKPILFGEDSIDHKTPLTRNGNSRYENLQIAHGWCNSVKLNKTMEEWEVYKAKIGGL